METSLADLTNRSHFRVTLKTRDDLTAFFPFDHKVEAYVNNLKARRLRPYTEQLDESWLVRVREKGHKPLSADLQHPQSSGGRR